MDPNSGSNQNMAHSALCRSGCGFYGNPAFEGMCSKCYKDAVGRRQQNPSPIQVQGRASPAVSSMTSSLTSATEAIKSSTTAVSVRSVDTATPTVPTATALAQDKTDDDEKATEGVSEAAVSETSSNDGDKDKKPKKNRCHTCKKKVGLTGFQCRCGGLYCGLHRYSDKHQCTFDYKEMAQQEIRKANPVIVGEKINKI